MNLQKLHQTHEVIKKCIEYSTLKKLLVSDKYNIN